MLFRRSLPLFVASLSLTAVAADDQCGLYMAVSSTATAEETTWGIYAGKDIPPRSQIGYHELAVNIHHLRANSVFADDDDEDEQDWITEITDFFEAFIWVPDPAGAKFELEGRAVTAIPGFGVMGGYNAKLTNAVWNQSAAYTAVVSGEEPGVAHPGRGANSPFYNVELVTKDEKITAGSEVFLDYGENWQEEEKKDQITREDYTRIDATVQQMMQFYEKHKESLDEDSKIQIYRFLIKDVMNAAVGPEKARRVSAILPPNPDDLYKVKEGGGSLAYSQPAVYRDTEWLEKYGRCIDNIRPGPSTIKNAGRGAFATRSVKKGAMVAPVPLVHIPDKIIFDMHDVSMGEDESYVRESDQVIGQQLLLNYCYGHPSSSMIFFPAGATTALINHSDKPNAKLVWSTHQSHHKEWFELTPHELSSEEHQYIGLMMEIVATRDIQQDEEIFIDYGAEWKAAWDKHVDKWNKKIKSGEISKEWPLRALDLNKEYRTKVFKTEAELKKDSYPEDVELKAFLMILDTMNKGTLEDPKKWGEPDEGTVFHGDYLFSCTVVDSKKVNDMAVAMPYNYTIRWTNNQGKATIVENVPHHALTFVDKPETSDQFVEDPFRHYVGIPDEIFPQAWREV